MVQEDGGAVKISANFFQERTSGGHGRIVILGHGQEAGQGVKDQQRGAKFFQDGAQVGQSISLDYVAAHPPAQGHVTGHRHSEDIFHRLNLGLFRQRFQSMVNAAV